ncbi:scopoletin glucosyltransferase-like [Hevea brasiliensis]|uniref:scopoletin glucosyltransferase-like n=1 Tax=Hevea brasiliensis TaxID=3981 RepID=UPI0025D411D5|nr:scopoletin glucosyltransferase-like [Hevea brasiliensis]
MDSLGHQLHIFVFPYMAHGHMIPIVDLAKLFALRGLKATIITTPLNAPLISKTIQRTKGLGVDIDIRTLKFPPVEAGLPEGCENVDSITSHNGSFELIFRFNKATTMLQEPLEMLLQECQPDCLVADLLFPWATDAAAKFGIPRIELKSFGIIVNSFYEVEPTYVDYYRKVLGGRAWPIGPVRYATGN